MMMYPGLPTLCSWKIDDAGYDSVVRIHFGIFALDLDSVLTIQ
jgi:hypothetical protein